MFLIVRNVVVKNLLDCSLWLFSYCLCRCLDPCFLLLRSCLTTLIKCLKGHISRIVFWRCSLFLLCSNTPIPTFLMQRHNDNFSVSKILRCPVAIPDYIPAADWSRKKRFLYAIASPYGWVLDLGHYASRCMSLLFAFMGWATCVVGFQTKRGVSCFQITEKHLW